MGLRAKLAATFLVLLSVAIFAISIASLDRTLRVMAGSVADSGERVGKEIFEHMRAALSSGRRENPEAALRADRGLRIAMQSAQAFSEYIVYVRIVSGDGSIIVAAEPDAGSRPGHPTPAIEVLRRRMDSAIPLALLPVLWGDHTYEMSSPVALNGKPFGSIKIGVSTGLIAGDVHRMAATMSAIVFGSLLLTGLVVWFLGNQMLRPVLVLTTGVEQLTEGADEVNFQIDVHDELGTLADKFNQLSHRVRSERMRWETEGGHLVDLFRSIADAVLLIDGDGSLLFANEEAHRRFGVDPAGGRTEGKPLAMLLGTDHPLMQLIGPALSGGGDVHDVALEIPERDGANARFLVSIFSLGQGPEPAGLLVMLRDLARMQELESVVDYSSRLARLGGLLSGVAHQVRGPLNAMTLQLELLRQEAQTGRPLDHRVERVRDEMKRLGRAVDALMRFMRPQALKAEEIVVNDLLIQIGGRVNQPGVKLEYRLEEGLPTIIADAGLLGEALQNIVQNAVEAMPRGGKLMLRSSSAGTGFVEIEIADQGVGIAADDLRHIFDLYFTTKQKGSGLGLPLALRAVDLIGGTISVDSKVGVGTTFKIRLPAGKDAKVAPALMRAV